MPRYSRRLIAAVTLGVVVFVVVQGGFSGSPPGKPTAGRTYADSGIADPGRSIANPSPDYVNACAPTGLDNSAWCDEVALEAIDNARAREDLGPMSLPSDFTTLPFAGQMLAVLDEERVARGLAPFEGTDATLDALAEVGAKVDDLPPSPGAGFRGVRRDFDDGFINALDLDFQWMYDDGPGSGTDGCGVATDPGCWADRHVVLARYRGGTAVMGAAVDPSGDTNSDDLGGPSGAVVLAVATSGVPSLAYSWAEVEASSKAGLLKPLDGIPSGYSLTGIADPPHTEHADYQAQCASTGLDDSKGCADAVLAAIDAARAREGVKPMTLPAGYFSLTVPEQLFVVVNLERVDRGLAPFAGISDAMDANAAQGADAGTDPPDPSGVVYDDELWSGGSVSALDSDYGWMYDDGRGSGNLDCPRTGGPGCWDHRNAILDDFGSAGYMVAGAAVDPTGDTAANGDPGGTSMALTLAVVTGDAPTYVFTWSQVQPSG